MNMAKEPRRIAIGPETDLLRVLEEVHADKEPRVVEKEGEAIAAIISMEDFATALGPSEEGMARALRPRARGRTWIRTLWWKPSIGRGMSHRRAHL